jgi:MFS family permease
MQPAIATTSASNRRAPFAALMAADAISMNGNMLAQLAIPWFVLETTGSVAQTGLTAAFGLLPLILASFFGGAVIDRLGHRQASVISDLASMLAVAAIPLLYTLGVLPFWLLLVLVFLGALLDAPGMTARFALRPDVARMAGLRLERANSISELVESGAQLSGPLLAGVLIALIGPGPVLWLNAVSFGISAVLVLLLVPAVTLTAGEVVPQAGRYLADLVEGVRFVLAEPPIRSIFVSAAVLNLLISPLLVVILPVYMNTVVGSAASLGFVIAAFGGGSVAGAAFYGVAGHRLPRRRTFVTGVFAMGLGFSTLAFLPPVWVMVVAMFVGGTIAGPNGPLISTVLQERTPAVLRGRVFGATTAVGFAGAPLGVLLAGGLLPVIGIQPTLIGIAVIFLSVALALALDQGLREMDDAQAD